MPNHFHAYVAFCAALATVVSTTTIKCAEPEDAADLLAVPAADRTLPPKELQDLLRLSDTLIDPTHRDRDFAALVFGEKYRHRYCIPALLAVMRKKDESHDLRQATMMSLSAIADKRVVDYLIDVVPEGLLGRQANEQLMKITGVSVGYINPSKPEVQARAEQIQQRWRQWWKANRKSTELRSNSAFNSEAVFHQDIEDQFTTQK